MPPMIAVGAKLLVTLRRLPFPLKLTRDLPMRTLEPPAMFRRRPLRMLTILPPERERRLPALLSWLPPATLTRLPFVPVSEAAFTLLVAIAWVGIETLAWPPS